jgi:protein-S-isoprenylcysteine O-methyltransferase Ste14
MKRLFNTFTVAGLVLFGLVFVIAGLMTFGIFELSGGARTLVNTVFGGGGILLLIIGLIKAIFSKRTPLSEIQQQ